MTGGIGICHLYVDASADQDKAVKIIHNAKTQHPTVCNSLDTVLARSRRGRHVPAADGGPARPATRWNCGPIRCPT